MPSEHTNVMKFVGSPQCQEPLFATIPRYPRHAPQWLTFDHVQLR